VALGGSRSGERRNFATLAGGTVIEEAPGMKKPSPWRPFQIPRPGIPTYRVLVLVLCVQIRSSGPEYE
jgi:hypothetical protein